ncbi:MAG: hypothetical protein HY868_11630 [Chloroflexi bacterium]|nr:hypothetical protein [Chloroflexota bacterium]
MNTSNTKSAVGSRKAPADRKINTGLKLMLPSVSDLGVLLKMDLYNWDKVAHSAKKANASHDLGEAARFKRALPPKTPPTSITLHTKIHARRDISLLARYLRQIVFARFFIRA